MRLYVVISLQWLNRIWWKFHTRGKKPCRFQIWCQNRCMWPPTQTTFKVGSILGFGFNIDTVQRICDAILIFLISVEVQRISRIHHFVVGCGRMVAIIHLCCSFLFACDSCHYNVSLGLNVISQCTQHFFFVPHIASKSIPSVRCFPAFWRYPATLACIKKFLALKYKVLWSAV